MMKCGKNRKTVNLVTILTFSLCPNNELRLFSSFMLHIIQYHCKIIKMPDFITCKKIIRVSSFIDDNNHLVLGVLLSKTN